MYGKGPKLVVCWLLQVGRKVKVSIEKVFMEQVDYLEAWIKTKHNNFIFNDSK